MCQRCFGGDFTEEEKGWISINRMAQMHGISRQTLILYDKMGLFKPAYVTNAGYRKYSAYQIPYLREICFLKELGLPLQEIKEHMENRDSKEVLQVLEQMEGRLEEQIRELERKKSYIRQRLEMMGHMGVKFTNLNRPYFEWREETKDILVPFETDQMSRGILHLTLMKAWDKLLEYGMIPSRGFGALIRYDAQQKTLRAVGSLIGIPFPEEVKGLELHTMPEGNYAVMYKYGMPYDMEPAQRLIDWVHEQGYEVDGDILDLCLLDTTYYDETHKEDFCQLYVPVKKRNE